MYTGTFLRMFFTTIETMVWWPILVWNQCSRYGVLVSVNPEPHWKCRVHNQRGEIFRRIILHIFSNIALEPTPMKSGLQTTFFPPKIFWKHTSKSVFRTTFLINVACFRTLTFVCCLYVELAPAIYTMFFVRTFYTVAGGKFCLCKIRVLCSWRI